MAGILPWVTGLFGIGQEVFNRSRAGYETSPQKRAFLDSVRNEQRIWQRDAEYNSPAQQMARFKEAGLNPHLIYGQGNPGNISGTSVQASGNIQPMDVVGQIMQSAMLGKDLELKDAQIEQIRANTELLGTKTGSELWKAKRLMQDWNYLEENYPELMEKLRRENKIGKETMEADIWKRQADSIHAGQLVETELAKQGLLEKDGQIKSEVLTSKRLQNAILEMQKNFITKGEMNAAQFWQALMIILSKSF